MLRPPNDAHEDRHLHHLIDQRSARADVHGRYPSISEYSDTPSVYSRAFFSPRPSNGADDDHPSPISPSHRSLNGSRLNDPTASMLDLDDDSRSSFAASDTYDDDHTAYEDGDDNEPRTRISYLGPKMRFHSRAPWEMEDGTLDEEDEPDENPRHFPSFGRSNGSKAIQSGSSSPRPSYATRPSGESSRSYVRPKRSFETINSQISYGRGDLYALAQESMSTNSLGRPAPTPPKETLRSKFSLGRLRPEMPTAPLPPPPVPTSPVQINFSPPRPDESGLVNNNPFANKNHSLTVQESFHPYANPDLVVSYADELPTHPSLPSSSSAMNYPASSRSDSNITVTESVSGDSLLRSSARSIMTPDTSMNSITSKHRASSIHAKNISSPVPVVTPPQRKDGQVLEIRHDHPNSLPSGVSTLPGWTERNAVPAFSLISLEEARAQRMRSSTANASSSRISSAIGTSNSSPPFPPGDGEPPQGVDNSPFGSSTSRARGRSISAGAKAKTTLQTIVGQPKVERRDSEPSLLSQQAIPGLPAGKSLKHKKSGFMRLFNGNKLQERDEHDGPPPVPSLPDNVQPSFPTQRAPKSPVHRIPAPTLSPSLLEVPVPQSRDSTISESNSWKPDLLSPRRTPPALSINTVPQASASRSSTSAVAERPTQAALTAAGKPWLIEQQPQSAPANVSEFPALRLRPVSALFSAHFGDHIVATDSRSSAETTDLDTPRSPSPVIGLVSPITPASFTRTSSDQMAFMSGSGDRSIVKGLQEQLQSAMTVKKAWQRQIWELEGMVRDLKAELEESKSKYNDSYCPSCGRGKKQEAPVPPPIGGSVVNRPRARTGTSSRFGNALP
ncbi:hypothetical protein M413DRAFT_15965 [Hebeloma cylindrosporum]|uniref:Uncharacterized protein n=1 Tax=Hebeloma cylindrosporum TaxID=76867 RepID=A0A0C2Z3T0_HEBCY|nr:hypothetical protein M413DRAFT_15965 [Hebeloma cylindrosporum h7]